jgi:hypothetical protein
MNFQVHLECECRHPEYTAQFGFGLASDVRESIDELFKMTTEMKFLEHAISKRIWASEKSV